MSGYRLVRPALFRLPPERAHGVAVRALEAIQSTPLESMLARRYAVEDDRLRVEALGQAFPNPVGVAAGFDKNAHIPNALGALGFGHVEIGGVTAQPQAGNPRPRLFRASEQGALINRMGFNNDGADVIADRLAAVDDFRVPIGANMGKSKAVPLDEAPADYRYTYERLAPVADYFVVNVSSPNTPGLRELQDRSHLDRIVGTLRDAGARPLLAKLSPDLTEPAIEQVIEVATEHDLEGLIAVNTTTDRPPEIRADVREQAGGLSGAPLFDRAVETVGFVADRFDGTVIGVGGIDGPDAAFQMLAAGADLVQLYTGLVYEGPSIARTINAGLLKRIEAEGFDDVRAVVGTARG